ncbi:hypothetical protein ACSBR2_034109 [Camellia fascicularis]
MGSWTDLLHSSSKLLEQAALSVQFPPLQVHHKLHFSTPFGSPRNSRKQKKRNFETEELRSIGGVVEKAKGENPKN